MPPADPVTSQFFVERLAGQGFTVILLVAGVYIIGRLLLAAQSGRIADLKERLDDHRKRFAEHDKQLENCNEDRLRLWRHIAAHGTPPKPMEFEQTHSSE